jgi:type IV secretion system protein VirB4
MTNKYVRQRLKHGPVIARERSTTEHIPYTRHMDAEILRTKDGLLVGFIKLDGFCFETADMAEINTRMSGRNSILRMLGSSRYAVYGHVIRRQIQPELEGEFTNLFAAELNRAYVAQLDQRRMFVNELYLSIVRRPLKGQAGLVEAIAGKLFKRGDKTNKQEAEVLDDHRELREALLATREALRSYGARTLTVTETVSGIKRSEPLEFLERIISGGKALPMPLPGMPLDEALARNRIHVGRNAMEIVGATPEDNRLVAMLSIKEYPPYTGPLILDGLLRVPHEFVVSQSFAIIDRPTAQSQIERVSRQIAMADEAGSIVGSQLVQARDELLGAHAIYGQHHMTVMCLGNTRAELDNCIRSVGATLTDQAIIWLREDLNCEGAFWAQLPGNFSYVARSATISSKNFAGFLSMHNYPAGRQADNHWGSAITLLETTSQSGYYFNFHVRDLGNFTLVGPSGSGKTVALSFLMAQSQRVRPQPRCVFFDKDRGADIFIRALGGNYEVLEPGVPTGFNPLLLADNGANREFLFQLFSLMLRRENQTRLEAAEEAVIREAVSQTLAGPDEQKNLISFAGLLRGRLRAGSDDLLTRFDKWLKPDQLGWLFNNSEDRLKWSDISGFDMTHLLDDPQTRSASLMYIFHRLEELLDGTPMLIFLDEGWRLLQDEVFADFIRNKMKTIRKFNGIIGFGTQSASDIVASPIGKTLIEQCETHILFPNPRADAASHLEGLSLTAREFDWIKNSDPASRAFLVKHGRESLIASLKLTGMDGILKVLSGRAETVAEADRLREKLGDEPNVWLPAFCGIGAIS